MNETSRQVEMFLSIAALSKTDQEKVMETVHKLSENKKAALKKTNPRPKAGFLKGAFQPPVEDVVETSIEIPDQTQNITDTQSEL